MLGGINQTKLLGFADSDRMVQEGNCAISGYAFFLGNLLVLWSSKQQTLVAASTYEAELIALARAMQEAIALTHLSEEILQIDNEPAMLYCDNKAVIKIVTDEELKYSERTKHLDLRRNFVRCYIEYDYINVEYVDTNDQRADILTKSLHVSQVKHLTRLLNLVDV